ncbi:MAG: oligopeptide/dipeptide ABC transporter ATP-binding protein [Acidimicrobiia bacterium]
MLSVEDLVVEFPVSKSKDLKVHAVSGVSFDVLPGETVGLVGESGCGKSTTAKAIALHTPITSGHVHFEGVDLAALSKSERREMRTRIQMIFQDPVSSLNPRRSVEDQIEEGLRIWKRGNREERHERARQVMSDCGLEYLPEAKRRRYQFSGGQCQRISIARAVTLDPEVLVCDEPVSALDVSVQAQILNLLVDMRQRYGLTMLFISHDLGVVHHISDRVVVMYLGKVCEVATPEALYTDPLHHYTDMLLSAIPVADPDIKGEAVPRGELPSPIMPPSGCRFRTRCPRAEERCAVEEPVVREIGENHFVACHFPISGPVAPPASPDAATEVAEPAGSAPTA